MKFLILAIPLMTTAITAGVVIAADTTAALPENIPPWAVGTGLVSATLGGPAFAVWYAWYMTTKRVPFIENRHAEQSEASEKRHAAHVELLINDFRTDLKEFWKYKREDDGVLRGLVDSMNRNINALTDEVKRDKCEYERERKSGA